VVYLVLDRARQATLRAWRNWRPAQRDVSPVRT